MTVPVKKFDVFFGTGGVGKTTLATARAIRLALDGKRVLLVTIDPAKRLKEVLGLPDSSAGEVVPIAQLPGFDPFTHPLHALLMSPDRTLERIAKTSQVPELAQNRIIKVLTRPNGGMNEILAVVELQTRLENGEYDCVVLDTAPGAHFLDFLQGLDKIRVFFDHRFVEIITSLGRKAAGTKSVGFAGNLVQKVLSAPVHKLLSYMQKVTGESFVDDFLGALQLVYQARASFLLGLKLEEKLSDSSHTNWFLTTSVEQGKVEEAFAVGKSAARLAGNGGIFLVLNKCLADELVDWQPMPNSIAARIKAALVRKEVSLIEKSRGGFQAVLKFPEVFAALPLDHVATLAQGWKDHG